MDFVLVLSLKFGWNRSAGIGSEHERTAVSLSQDPAQQDVQSFLSPVSPLVVESSK